MALKRTLKPGYTKLKQRRNRAILASKLQVTPRKPKKEPKVYPHSSEKQRERYARQGHGTS